MARIVYFLGAGFSAPLGLPVMRDFLIKSKDMYFRDPDKWDHFFQIFQTISKLHVVKSYYEADLYNIEEILSILEMHEGLFGKPDDSEDDTGPFRQYIADVIDNCTPEVTQNQSLPANYWDHLLGGQQLWQQYGFFAASLFGLQLQALTRQGGQLSKPVRLHGSPVQGRHVYSVVTMNYDTVLERIVSCLADQLDNKEELTTLRFADPELDVTAHPNEVFLTKLHGSSSSPKSIVPPTWNKSLRQDTLAPWKTAHELLRRANHLRIIGYSLPESDAYVRYLLKSAAVEAPNLKTIDVICLDPDGSVEKRFKDFIDFNYYRFKNANVDKYLKDNHERHIKEFRIQAPASERNRARSFTKLEDAHKEFMQAD